MNKVIKVISIMFLIIILNFALLVKIVQAVEFEQTIIYTKGNSLKRLLYNSYFSI